MTPDTLALVADALEATLSLLSAKAAPSPEDAEADAALPSSGEILSAALDATGLREGFEAGTLDGRDHLDLLHAVRLEGRKWLRAEAEALLAEVAPDSTKALMGGVKAAVGRFFGRVGKGLREIFAAGVLALAGPDASVLEAPVVQEALDTEIDRQLEYLDDFRRRVVSEAKPLDGRVVTNTEQFGSSTWGVAQEVVRKAAAAGGVFDQEMRKHYGPDKPCPTCIEEEGRGWQPIGTLKAIGDSECLCNCHCGFLYKSGASGQPHVAGRGPLHEAAFGGTG